MEIWISDVLSVIKEKRLTLRTVLLVLILMYILASALFLITGESTLVEYQPFYNFTIENI